MSCPLGQKHNGEGLRLAFSGGEVASLSPADEPEFWVGEDLVREFEVAAFWTVAVVVLRGMRAPSPCVSEVQLGRDHLADCCVLCVCRLLICQISQLQLCGMDDLDFWDVDGNDDVLAQDRWVGIWQAENGIGLFLRQY